jgi:hypothetical protein
MNGAGSAGVRIAGQTTNNSQFPDGQEFLALNDTFFNDSIGVDLIAVAPSNNPNNSRSTVQFVGMDNVFDGSTVAAVQSVGRSSLIDGSQLQYNLFFNNAVNVTGPIAGANFQPVLGDPKFVAPSPNPGGNYQIQEGSAAIDAARSELSLDPTASGNFITAPTPASLTARCTRSTSSTAFSPAGSTSLQPS